jgi:hypothetical protein
VLGVLLLDVDLIERGAVLLGAQDEDRLLGHAVELGLLLSRGGFDHDGLLLHRLSLGRHRDRRDGIALEFPRSGHVTSRLPDTHRPKVLARARARARVGSLSNRDTVTFLFFLEKSVSVKGVFAVTVGRDMA